MRRRSFLGLAAASPTLGAATLSGLPEYRIVSTYKPAAQPGMPGRYPGQVVRVHAEQSIDTTTEKLNVPVVREMISQGMRGLTGVSDDHGAWSSFFSPSD